MPAAATATQGLDLSDAMESAKEYADAVQEALARLSGPVEELKKRLAGLSQVLAHAGGGLDDSRAKAKGFGQTLKEWVGGAVERVRGSLQALQGASATVWANLQQHVLGWVRAGLQGTAQAAMLDFHFQQLGRGIAAIFLPVVDQVVNAVRVVADWFNNLSEGQQNLIARLVMAAAAFGAVGVILPKLAAAFGVVSAAVKALGAAVGIASGGILPLIGLVVAGLGALGVGIAGVAGATGDGSEALSGFGEVLSQMWAAVQPVLAAVGAAFTEAFEAARPALEALMATLGQVAGVIGGSLAGAVQAIAPALAKVGSLVVQIGAVFAEVGGKLLAAVMPVAEFFVGVLAVAVETVADIVAGIVPIFAEVANAVGDFFGDLAKNLKPLLDQLMTSVKTFGLAIKEAFLAVKPILQYIADGFMKILDYVKPVAMWIGEKVVGAINAVVEGITRVIATLKVLKDMHVRAILDPSAFIANVDAEFKRLKAEAAAAGQKKSEGKAGGTDKDGRKIAPQPGSFEDIGNLYKRIQQAAFSTGGEDKDDPAKQTADGVKKTNDLLKDISDKLDAPGAEPKPPPLR